MFPKPPRRPVVMGPARRPSRLGPGAPPCSGGMRTVGSPNQRSHGSRHFRWISRFTCRSGLGASDHRFRPSMSDAPQVQAERGRPGAARTWATCQLGTNRFGRSARRRSSWSAIGSGPTAEIVEPQPHGSLRTLASRPRDLAEGNISEIDLSSLLQPEAVPLIGF